MRSNRKRFAPALSRLESLPTEMLQSIFEYSANVELPLVSPRLASQLASGVLHHQITSQILHEILNDQHAKASASSVVSAQRLMNSRFFTWSFFTRWLYSEFERQALLDEWRGAMGEDADTSNNLQLQEWIWYRLHPSPALPPPMKLLRRPFTEDTVQFVKFMVNSFREEPETLGFLYREAVQEGLQQVVEDGVGHALNAFFSLGAQIDTELLRKAVIDSGCEEEVVRRLITRTIHLTTAVVDVDFLDPALWSWADKAKARGDRKGPWLIEQLKSAARDAGQDKGRGSAFAGK